VIVIRSAAEDDLDWVIRAAREVLGSEYQVHSRRQFTVTDVEVLVAERAGERAGFLAWEVDGDTVETLAIGCTIQNRGVGSALMDEVQRRAAGAGCSRLRVVTTDDNAGAQRFYERLGYELVGRIVGGVDECRRLYKPEIPPGAHDELEYARAVAG
jgi:ribosomal protein S18 acetylase RimI-like enzyme